MHVHKVIALCFGRGCASFLLESCHDMIELLHSVSKHRSMFLSGGRGCKLVAAGTYKPGLQLLLLQPGEPNQGVSQQPCFLPFASVAITPLMHQTFQGGAAAAPEEPPGSPRKALPDQAIPESVQILPLQSRHDDVQVIGSQY